MTDRESDANAIDPPENTKADAEAQTEDDKATIDPPENTGGGS
jgi:hypothetical protein